MCVVLDYFGEESVQTVKERAKTFYCYDCFDHSGKKIYPVSNDLLY